MGSVDTALREEALIRLRAMIHDVTADNRDVNLAARTILQETAADPLAELVRVSANERDRQRSNQARCG
jgi:hypothetical protein